LELDSALRYYELKYNDNSKEAFVHLIRELGQIAFGIETNNKPVLKAKIMEASAILKFLAHIYEIDVVRDVESIYAKKILQFQKKPNN
jgi:hypothetical protein